MKIKADAKLRKMSPKKFILNHLIPFILRDAGRGFAMDQWKTTVSDDEEAEYIDGLYGRKAPACGTVACIGGSIQCLTGLTDADVVKSSKLLGLSPEQTEGLFHLWEVDEDGWPKKYARRFNAAETPYKKARVACSLLRQIALKGGKVLPNADES